MASACRVGPTFPRRSRARRAPSCGTFGHACRAGRSCRRGRNIGRVRCARHVVADDFVAFAPLVRVGWPVRREHLAAGCPAQAEWPQRHRQRQLCGGQRDLTFILGNGEFGAREAAQVEPIASLPWHRSVRRARPSTFAVPSAFRCAGTARGRDRRASTKIRHCQPDSKSKRRKSGNRPAKVALTSGRIAIEVRARCRRRWRRRRVCRTSGRFTVTWSPLAYFTWPNACTVSCSPLAREQYKKLAAPNCSTRSIVTVTCSDPAAAGAETSHAPDESRSERVDAESAPEPRRGNAGTRAGVRRRVEGHSRAVARVPKRCVRARKFICGEPMNPATKRLAGRLYSSSGAPICSTRPARRTTIRSAIVIAST